MSRNPAPFVVALSLLAAAALAGGDPPAVRVSGTLTVDGTPTPLVLSYVDESADDIIVLLASKEVPRDVGPFVRKRSVSMWILPFPAA